MATRTDLDYPFDLRPLPPDEGGGWLVEFPDLPGCIADGETPEEAIREAEDTLRSYVLTLRELGKPIPAPSRGEGRTLRVGAPASPSPTLRRRGRARAPS